MWKSWDKHTVWENIGTQVRTVETVQAVQFAFLWKCYCHFWSLLGESESHPIIVVCLNESESHTIILVCWLLNDWKLKHVYVLYSRSVDPGGHSMWKKLKIFFSRWLRRATTFFKCVLSKVYSWKCIFTTVFPGDQGGQGNHRRPGGFGQMLRVHRRNHQKDWTELICHKHFFLKHKWWSEHCSFISILPFSCRMAITR